MTDYLPISTRLVGPLVFFGLLLLVLAVLGKVPLKYNVRNLVVRGPLPAPAPSSPPPLRPPPCRSPTRPPGLVTTSSRTVPTICIAA